VIGRNGELRNGELRRFSTHNPVRHGCD